MFLKYLRGTVFKMKEKDAMRVAKKFDMNCGHRHNHKKSTKTNERVKFINLDKLFKEVEKLGNRRASVQQRSELRSNNVSKAL